ncbi:BXL5, partial [Symbiodinium necroappetens]
ASHLPDDAHPADMTPTRCPDPTLGEGRDASDLLNLGGTDLIGLQELGGCLDIPAGRWDTKTAFLQGQEYSFVIAMREILEGTRYHDNIFILSDLNYELVDLTSEMADERSALLNLFIRDVGLSFTKPCMYTWSNTRGASSRIDYILYRTPHQTTLDEQVVPESDVLIGSDHRLCTLCVSTGAGIKRRRQKRTKCGKWIVDYTKAVPALNRLAEAADIREQDLHEKDFVEVAARSCHRPRGLRFKDPPEVTDLIRDRRAATDPLQKRQLGREVMVRRAECKKEWRTKLLDRAAAGDYQVISYFKRKQGVNCSQLEYCQRCGGTGPAVGGLKSFYKQKYEPPEPQIHDALGVYCALVGKDVPAPALVTKEELEEVLLHTKSRKSCGRDGAPYEFWCAVLQSDAADHLVEFVNDLLLGNIAFPQEWTTSQIVLLAKTKEPAVPKDFRPIVLAATLSKLVTKALLVRL